MNKILLALFLLFPILSFASGLSKQDACDYAEGIHQNEVYILWPGKFVRVDEFLKKDGFLYYFIHTFPDQKSLDGYRQNEGDPNAANGYIRNTGSHFASFDCARSKVRFYPNIASVNGTAYGKLNWISGNILSYSLVGTSRDPCTTGPDTILDMTRMTNIRFDRFTGLPKSTKDICIGRSTFKNMAGGVIQFDIEEHHWDTDESFYSRYQYQFSIRKLKKIW